MILKNRDHTPPGGFRYVHAETGFESVAIDIHTWMENIRAHRKANQLPEITEAEAMDQLCKTIPPQWCEHEVAGRKWVNTRLRFSDIVNGAKAYLSLIASGFQTVSQDEADRRARICSSCYLRIIPQGCGSCVKLGNLIVGDIAGKTTAYDNQLRNRACAACACPLSPLVHFPLAILEQTDNNALQEILPEFCWRKKSGENYQS